MGWVILTCGKSQHVHSGIGSANHLPVVYAQTVLSTFCATHLWCCLLYSKLQLEVLTIPWPWRIMSALCRSAWLPNKILQVSNCNISVGKHMYGSDTVAVVMSSTDECWYIGLVIVVVIFPLWIALSDWVHEGASSAANLSYIRTQVPIEITIDWFTMATTRPSEHVLMTHSLSMYSVPYTACMHPLLSSYPLPWAQCNFQHKNTWREPASYPSSCLLGYSCM